MYQGHRSKPAWNVALWLFNDETLYRCVQRLLCELPARTPDGYRYTKTTVRAALEHWEG